jgi:hypothetical protein
MFTSEVALTGAQLARTFGRGRAASLAKMASKRDPSQSITEEAQTRVEALARRVGETFQAEQGELLSMSLRGLIRLLDFLEITAWEYARANDAAVERGHRHAAAPLGARKLTPEEQAQWQADYVYSVVLQLRIETFYVFADILLDRIANVFVWLFGQSAARSARLSKHDHMKKKIVAYAADKQLSPVPETLMKLARQLAKQVGTYRISPSSMPTTCAS